MSENSALEKLLAALNIEQKDKIEEKETKPHSCGCANKCSVEYGGCSTSSLQLAAGIFCGARLQFCGSSNELLLFAQICNPEVKDQKRALYLFGGCPKIIEYAEKFPDWKDAVREVRSELYRKLNF